MAEFIVQIEESEKNMDERFIGQLRSYPELIRCKDCENSKNSGIVINIYAICGQMELMCGLMGTAIMQRGNRRIIYDETYIPITRYLP